MRTGRSTRETSVTTLSDHFRIGGSGAIRTQTSAALKQRMCEGPRSTARQQGRPPQPPSLTSSDPQVRWLASGLGPGQTADEVLSFLGPPSPDLAGQHNQPGPPVTHTLSSGGSRTFLQVDKKILQRTVMPGFCETGRSAKVRFSGAKDTECRDGGRTASTVKMCRPIERETPDAQVVHDGASS